ncbi:Hypothetical predicted protein [Paramuricea clavata]|uniref:Uncharacterized protein n=1 Tax=Paramuricea clavata TaxID=317549 RepID=A0A6S7I2N2_PARCT|nr:Hypothetical predicted protein [Paramuricea clavata]
MHSLQEQHPEVYSEFIAGNHSISRSQQPFGQVWSDMALEQSINCDSKSKGGLVGITQQDGAVDRWLLTSHERAAITRSLKEMCRVENDKIGTHKETSVMRIERDKKDVQRLVSCFTTGLANNPFVTEDEGNTDHTPLSNIATGLVVPNEVADRLVNAFQIGTTSMHDFINARLDTNKVCFWDPLKKLKIDTFKVTTRTISLKGTRGKVVTLNADRELFGRLLVVAKTRDINLKEILSYELSCVPVSLVHPDGTMRKTAKSLMPILERNVDSISRLPVLELRTAVIIDAMALIQMVKSAGAATFGEMAGKYFDIITRVLSQNNCSRLDLVFDQYRAMSIKAAERQERGESLSMEIKIHNQNTPVPKQWNKFISNPKNKQNLATFLCESLLTILKTQLHPRQNVFIAGGFKDGRETVSCIRGNSSSVSSLFSDQDEADTRLLLHAKHASNTHQRVVVQSPDTDVAVLCVVHFQNIRCRELWFQTGLKDKARFIPIHSFITILPWSFALESLASIPCMDRM